MMVFSLLVIYQTSNFSLFTGRANGKPGGWPHGSTLEKNKRIRTFDH